MISLEPSLTQSEYIIVNQIVINRLDKFLNQLIILVEVDPINTTLSLFQKHEKHI